MLQNAYLLAKIGADTAENERNFAENLPRIGNYPTGPATHASPQGRPGREGPGPRRRNFVGATSTPLNISGNNQRSLVKFHERKKILSTYLPDLKLDVYNFSRIPVVFMPRQDPHIR